MTLLLEQESLSYLVVSEKNDTALRTRKPAFPCGSREEKALFWNKKACLSLRSYLLVGRTGDARPDAVVFAEGQRLRHGTPEHPKCPRNSLLGCTNPFACTAAGMLTGGARGREERKEGRGATDAPARSHRTGRLRARTGFRLRNQRDGMRVDMTGVA